MKPASPIRSICSRVLVVLVATAAAGQALGAAGRIEFAVGGATLARPGGDMRPLARGVEVDSGDILRTTDGRVQVRMADGAYISLQPDTEFAIKEYRFSGKADGTESALYSLLKGAMRTVTGLIGRVNRNRYQVSTPTATVGIRGTGGVIRVLGDSSTLVHGTSGIWFLQNPAGSIDIPAGISGLATADFKIPPRVTSVSPSVGPAPLPQLIEYVQGEQREGNGSSVITGGILQSGPGYMAAFAYGFCPDTCVPVVAKQTDDALFNGTGQLIEFGVAARAGSLFRLETGGRHAEFGTDGILAWGRWVGLATTGSSTVPEIYGPSLGLHYVVGTPTASMPQSGPATYTMIGATSPTEVNALLSPGTFSGTLTIADWATGDVTLNLNIDMAKDGRGYLIDGTARIAGSTFGATFISTQAGVSGTIPTSCATSCTANIEGFFAGNVAERAGLGYRVNDVSGTTAPVVDIVGAAAFAKQ